MHYTTLHCNSKGFVQAWKRACVKWSSLGGSPDRKQAMLNSQVVSKCGEHEWSPFTLWQTLAGTWSCPVMALRMVQQITLSEAKLKAAPLPSRTPTPLLRVCCQEPERDTARDDNHYKERKLQIVFLFFFQFMGQLRTQLYRRNWGVAARWQEWAKNHHRRVLHLPSCYQKTQKQPTTHPGWRIFPQIPPTSCCF